MNVGILIFLGRFGVLSTNDIIGLFSPVIFPCSSILGPGVSNLFARFTLSPLFGK